MKSVRDWAEVRGYDYEFIDDKIFDLVPEWYLKKAEGKITLITDLARLELARQY